MNTLSQKYSKSKIISQETNSIQEDVQEIAIGTYEAFEKAPRLKIETISEATYLSAKPLPYFEPKKRLSESALKKYSGFSSGNNQSVYECLGFYKRLNCYAFTKNYREDGFGFGQFFLLDISKKIRYTIVSFGDGSVSLPALSPNGDFLLYYYNSPYGSNCNIGVLKVNHKAASGRLLTEFASFSSTDFIIENVVQHSDSDFYVKAIQETNSSDNQSVYFKINLKQ